MIVDDERAWDLEGKNRSMPPRTACPKSWENFSLSVDTALNRTVWLATGMAGLQLKWTGISDMSEKNMYIGMQ